MKDTRNQRHWRAGLAAMATLAILAVGCSSAGYSKGDKTAANIQKAADRIGALPAQIDKTIDNLNQLVNNPQPDLRPQFKAYSKSLKEVESAADHIASARRSMAEREKEFFAKWDEQLAEINNEDIKARSQSRREDVAAKLTAIKFSYEEAEQAFRPLIADLRDVQKVLSVDLTPDGVATVRPIVTKAMQDVGPVNESIQQLASDFQALGVSMSSVAPKSRD